MAAFSTSCTACGMRLMGGLVRVTETTAGGSVYTFRLSVVVSRCWAIPAAGTAWERAAFDVGEAAEFEDRFLGVHGGDLAAQLGQRVDHGHPEATEAGVVGREQARGPGADDQEVGLGTCRLGGHVGDPSPSRVTGSRPRAPPSLLKHVLVFYLVSM